MSHCESRYAAAILNVIFDAPLYKHWKAQVVLKVVVVQHGAIDGDGVQGSTMVLKFFSVTVDVLDVEVVKKLLRSNLEHI